MPIALITGCSSGIGRALADALKLAGYVVWATARKDADLATLSAEGFTAVKLDVNDAKGLIELAERLEAHGAGLDVLINNAGYGEMGPVLDLGIEGLQRQFSTNVFAPVGVTRVLFPLLRRQCGLVVNIGSVSGVLVTPFAGVYCASKAAVHALSDALRMELAPFSIGVMEVQPGAIASEFGHAAQAQTEGIIDARSPWWPARDGIRARASASLQNPTDVRSFAGEVVAALQRRRPPKVLRAGHGSRALPLLAALLPKALLERILRKRFGLNKPL